MKERIEIPREKIKVLTSGSRFPVNGYFTFNKDDVKVEKYPTNWEELKELCKANDIDIIANYIYAFGWTFFENGNIGDVEGNVVAENRTPQQMWQIIKSLIGEE